MTAQPRAAIYCRVSTDRQEEEGTSLETQEARQRAYCDDHGYHLVAVYRETYSGFELRRPQLDRLREAIRTGAVDVVVCYAVDRLSRNQAHTAILLYELDEAGVRVEFVTEKFEDSAVGKFILSAKAFAAEIEREKIKERTQRGARARVESGKLGGYGPPPYGYQWNEARTGLLPDPATSPVVYRIFTAVADGKTLRLLAAELDRDGIPTPRGREHWTHATIRTILTNPAYMGRAEAFRWSTSKVNGKQRVRLRAEHERVSMPAGVVPALVDADMWQAAQVRLAYNRAHTRRQPAQPESHLLAGISCAPPVAPHSTP